MSTSLIMYNWLHCSCPLEGRLALPIHLEVCGASPESYHKFIWGLLTLSPELIPVLYWDFPPFLHHSDRQVKGWHQDVSTVLGFYTVFLLSSAPAGSMLL